MKRRNLFVTLFTLILAICMLSQVAVFADWEPYYPQTITGNATKVVPSYNDLGQKVYTVYNSYGNVVLDIRARGGNIWNNTTQVLLTDSNKDCELVGISMELNVYGVNYSSEAMRYRNGFQKGEVPYRLPDVKVISFQTDSQGFAIGINTGYGIVSLDNNYNSNSNNCNNYDYDYNSYPRVTQQGNEYYYYYSSNRYYTYKYNPSTEKLSINSSSTSGITEIKFAPGYVFAVTTTNTVKQIEIGTINTVHTYSDKFKDWIYQTDTNGQNWVRGYIDIYNSRHYFEIDYDDYDEYYDYDDDYNNYDDYPYFYQNGNQYTYYVSSNKKYSYTWTSSGKLSYGNVVIAYNVEQVEFAQGKIVYVVRERDDYEATCYEARLGSTSGTLVCSNFYEFEYDNDGFVTEAIDGRGRSYDL